MTREEKAKKLISINSLVILTVIGNKLPMDEVKEIAKQCALIAVDELIEHGNYDNEWYWQSVKEMIGNL